MRKAQDIIFEWSYLFDVEALEDKAIHVSITPEAEDSARIAKRLSLLSLNSLKANLEIVKMPGSMVVHVQGVVDAEVVQECVATAEPVVSSVHESFEAWFADKDAAISLSKARQDKMIAKGQTEMPIVEEKDDPEPIIDGQIDLGELAVQYLSLALDPYPRAEGVELTKENQEDSPFSFKNPFAALKEWKGKQTGQE